MDQRVMSRIQEFHVELIDIRPNARGRDALIAVRDARARRHGLTPRDEYVNHGGIVSHRRILHHGLLKRRR